MASKTARRLAGIAIVLFAGSIAHLNAQQQAYVIGPQDLLTITVWDQEDLGGKFAVETDGTFTFPLIGRVQASGRTLRELETELKNRLMDGFFRNPQVSVAIEQYRSQRVFIVGEVRSPGPYPLTGDMSLIEAIARAGSTLPSASDEALIVRPSNGSTSQGPTLPNVDNAAVTRIDLKNLQSGGFSQNVVLRDGDTIFVPRAETVYVFGHVKNPGSYAVQKDTTVLQALSLAGGVTDRGATGRIRIVRHENGKEQEVRVKLSDSVRAGDTIIVPERFF
jgi:polysaccharide export outer membrane protein